MSIEAEKAERLFRFPGRRPTGTMPKLHRNVWVTSLGSFLTDVSSEMIWNVLPLFLANVLGIRMAAIGLIEGAAESLSSLLKIASGYLSDRAGKRKPLAVIGYAVSTAAKPFLYLASSWSGVLAVRVTDRIGKGIRTAPRDALLAASVSSAERGFAFGLHRAADTAGAFVGLLAAGVIVFLTQRGAVALEATVFRRLVLASLIPAGLAVAVLAAGLREVELLATARERPVLSLRGLGREFRWFLAAVLVFTLGNSADAFLVLRAQERGLSVLGILGMLAAFNLVYTAVSLPAGRWSDAVGRRRVLVTGWLAYALIYLGFALAGTASHIVVLYTVYGCYHGLADGAARASVADLVPEARRGTAFGLYHAAVGVAALPASLAAGALWQRYGPAAPFYAGAGLAVVATWMLVNLPSRFSRNG